MALAPAFICAIANDEIGANSDTSIEGERICGETVLNISSMVLLTLSNTEVSMIRKLILGTASVFALGIGGAALDFSADANEVSNAAPGPAHHWLNSASLSKDDIRWAQVKLHMIGFYEGSLDGMVGPETKRAILGFQKSNNLEQTGTLDQQTADALIGDTVVGQGSSTPPKGASDPGAGQK
jgi:peptidoglycan hydrolase-like protein with peptidoglycan-binding domain